MEFLFTLIVANSQNTETGKSATAPFFGIIFLTWQLLLRHVDLALVHVVEDGADVVVLDVLEEDDRVVAHVLREQRLEVRGAGAEDDLVTLEAGAVAGDGDVAEGLRLEEVVEDGEQVGAVVVPPEAELLRGRVHLGDGELR